MGLTIANNVSSLTAQNNLGRSNVALKRSLERLSSGFKVNRGADGPAALVISEKQRTQIAGLRQAITNSEKAVALVQTAEGALNEINSLLVKVRSLALDSANSAVNDNDALAANQAEIDNAIDTINRIANNTQFTTKKLLDGSSGISGTPSNSNVTFLQATTTTAAGTHTVNVSTVGERANIEAGTGQTAALAQDETLTINGVTVDLFLGMTQTQVRDRINEFTSQTGVIADITTGGDTRLYTAAFGDVAKVEVISDRAAAVDSTGFGNAAVTDVGANIVVDIAGDSFNGKGNVVTADAGVARGLSLSLIADTGDNVVQTVSGDQGVVTVSDNSLVFQIGPNQNQTAKVAVSKTHSASLGIGVPGNQFNNLAEIDVTSESKAQDALAVIDSAVDDVTNLRGTLGAFQQNTLEATANNLRATLENTVNAESVIRDTDFAAEIAEFTKQQVLLQAGTSVLGNANQIPQLVLSLLG
jgi:flagellin